MENIINEGNKEKEYQCPNCDADKPEYREECPECEYIDKRSRDGEEK